MAEREQPVVAPRPLYGSLPKAVEAALDHENTPGTIRFECWAKTFDTTTKKVAAEFEKQRRERLTRVAPASVPDDIGEGK